MENDDQSLQSYSRSETKGYFGGKGKSSDWVREKLFCYAIMQIVGEPSAGCDLTRYLNCLSTRLLERQIQ